MEPNNMRNEPNTPEVSPRAREAAKSEIRENCIREGSPITYVADRLGEHVQRALDAAVAEEREGGHAKMHQDLQANREQVARLTKELAAAKNGCEQLQAVLAIRDKKLAKERNKYKELEAAFLKEEEGRTKLFEQLSTECAARERAEVGRNIWGNKADELQRKLAAAEKESCDFQESRNRLVVQRDTLAQRVAELEKALQSLQKNENQS